MVLGPVIASNHYGGARSWGVLLTCSGIGSVLGGALALRQLPQRAVPIAYCVLLMSTTPALFALGAALPLVATAVLLGLYGLGLTLFDTIWHSSLQHLVPTESLGRIASFDAVVSLGLRPVGLAIAGPIGYAVGTEDALIGAAVLTAVLTGLVIISPAVRTLRIVEAPQLDAVHA
jgi:hypothetical protein